MWNIFLHFLLSSSYHTSTDWPGMTAPAVSPERSEAATGWVVPCRQTQQDIKSLHFLPLVEKAKNNPENHTLKALRH